jgi:hypothetical protein
MYRAWLTRTLTFALLLPLLLVVGCGGQGSVEGTVTYRPNGKKLVWGTVMITGSDNISRYGTITKDGTYAVNGVVSGPAKITVTSENPKAAAATARDGGRGADGRSRPGAEGAANTPAPPPIPDEILKGWFAIPDKYGDATQSGLTVTVKGGKNTHDIILD